MLQNEESNLKQNENAGDTSRMDQSQLPKRAHSITINAGGDTFEDLHLALKDIISKIEESIKSSVVGSPSFGYFFAYEVNVEMTRRKYAELIEQTRHQSDTENDPSLR